MEERRPLIGHAECVCVCVSVLLSRVPEKTPQLKIEISRCKKCLIIYLYVTKNEGVIDQ